MGWTKLWDSIWSSWQGSPEYFRAWCWMWSHAEWADGKYFKRGQLPFSCTWAPFIWGKSEDWAQRFLRRCATGPDPCILWEKSRGGRPSQREDPAAQSAAQSAVQNSAQSAGVFSVITILNYDKYAGCHNEGASQGAAQSAAQPAVQSAATSILIDKEQIRTDIRNPPSGGPGGGNLETQKTGKTPFTRDTERLKRYLSDLKADLERFRQKYGPLGVDVDRTYEDFMATVLNGNGTINLPNPYRYVPPFANGFRTWCQKRIDKKAAIAHVPKKPWTPPEQKGK